MEDEPEKPSNAPSKGYGKHSAKFWIITYVIVAAVLYTIIYFAFIRKSGGTGSSGGFGY